MAMNNLKNSPKKEFTKNRLIRTLDKYFKRKNLNKVSDINDFKKNEFKKNEYYIDSDFNQSKLSKIQHNVKQNSILILINKDIVEAPPEKHVHKKVENRTYADIIKSLGNDGTSNNKVDFTKDEYTDNKVRINKYIIDNNLHMDDVNEIAGMSGTGEYIKIGYKLVKNKTFDDIKKSIDDDKSISKTDYDKFINEINVYLNQKTMEANIISGGPFGKEDESVTFKKKSGGNRKTRRRGKSKRKSKKSRR